MYINILRCTYITKIFCEIFLANSVTMYEALKLLSNQAVFCWSVWRFCVETNQLWNLCRGNLSPSCGIPKCVNSWSFSFCEFVNVNTPLMVENFIHPSESKHFEFVHWFPCWEFLNEWDSHRELSVHILVHKQNTVTK